MNPTPAPHSRAVTAANRFTWLLLLIYLAALTWILILKMGVRFSYMDSRQVSLIPFYRNIVLHARLDKVEIVMNVIVFIPLGIYTGILFPHRKWGTQLLWCLLVSTLIESLQFLLAVGAFDATDIVTNTTGALIGLIFFAGMKRLLSTPLKAQQWINWTAALLSLLAVVLLALLKLGMLPIRYQ